MAAVTTVITPLWPKQLYKKEKGKGNQDGQEIK
jgi:hypothetical protein